LVGLPIFNLQSYHMLKAVIVFIFGIVFWQSAHAQKLDSLMVNMSADNRILNSKDSADHFLQIMFPADSSSGIKINKVKEFSLDGHLKLIGTAIIIINASIADLKFVGPRIDYYPNGHKKSVTDYRNGFAAIERLYYPNGKLYAVYDMKNPVRPLLIECHDITGKMLSEKGDGNWIEYDGDFKKEIKEGAIKDSLEEGEWHILADNSIKYTTIYKHGIDISSTDPNWEVNRVFMSVEQEPHFKTGSTGFNHYLAKAVKFSAFDRQNGTQGKVIITFVVEKDGTLSNVRALRGPTQTMMNAGVEAVQQSPPWIPGTQNGKPVRVQYTISFAFSLANN